jgi:hypothetical protein
MNELLHWDLKYKKWRLFINIMKACSICEVEKELTEFYSQKRKTGHIYYHPECKSCTSKRSVNWQKGNPEQQKQIFKNYNAKPERKKMVKQDDKSARDRGLRTEWRREHKDREGIYRENHTNHLITDNEWESCLNYFDWSCAYCEMSYDDHIKEYGQQLHKEHANHDGNDYIDNCIPSCRTCNTSKHDKDFTEWYNENNTHYKKRRLNKIIKWITGDWMKHTE